MATILLSAAGAAIGGGFGGAVLGLSGAVIGRAVGATLGQAIDQRLLGAGSQAVETGKIDRLRLTAASEGQTVGRVWGRMRVGGQVIWATRFLEHRTTENVGGKGAPSATNTQFSYSVSLAVAICEGEILRIGRVWADGTELDPATVTMRLYPGSSDQLPDPKISAVEGADAAPAYRGIAYVVFEDLNLAPFGNRVPQFTFEVSRAAQGEAIQPVPDLVRGVRGVALIPGTGEYSLAVTKVREGGASFVNGALTGGTTVNQHAPGERSDFEVALTALDEELPACEAVSLVVSWFGNDLRCGMCQIAPKVSDAQADGSNMPWSVSGLTRSTAGVVPRLNGSPVYGGTPSDQSVIEAISAMRDKGKTVTFYPFILMEQMADNGLPAPWNDADNQAVLPWRGRITLSVGPGRDGSPDRTAAADAEVAAFIGDARVADFALDADTVGYTGPEEFSLRRFVLHYAHLCKLAGGVEAFCIGSELRGLTQIRGAGDRFPVVEALRQLAADVRSILGPDCKIGYAADWSEYFGYKSPEGARYFHLDPLWADENIDFIGIDNYMPLSDWREGETHVDADWCSIYNLEYLQSNIEGGEGFDWYYASEAHRAAQIRTPITDGAHDEPWIWRYKDLRGFWENHHHERVNGVRSEEPTPWVPRSKPIWFTEYGCAAIDKATNQPNKFLDPKSSESSAPRFSDGRRDDLIQMQYLRAMTEYWAREENNPDSDVYDGQMIDMSKAYVWAWDARPYPQFPAFGDLWTDAANYARGHWISGRAVAQPLASVVAEICESAGLTQIDVSALHGVVRGYVDGGDVSARGVLQSLMLAYGFEAVERGGRLVFKMRDGRIAVRLNEERLAFGATDAALQTMRAPEAELSGRVRLHYTAADGGYDTRTVEAIFPDERAGETATSALPLALTRAEAQRTVERWLTEARVARDGAQFALPPSLGYLGAGDVVALQTGEGERRYRIDRAEQAEAINIEAVRVEPAVYQPSDEAEEDVRVAAYVPPVPVTPIFLDLPLMTGQEVAHAPHVAALASPWPGSVAVYSSVEDDGYRLNTTLEAAAVVGETLTPLKAARTGLWDRGAPLRIRLVNGALSGASEARIFSGANLMAIGDGVSDSWELFQFAEAEPVEPGIWEVRRRLRGQLGTDALMPEVWPEGSVVVLMDAAVEQIDLLPSARNLARHYRIGSALRGYDDASYTHAVRAFSGVGLRPLSPAHLRAKVAPSGGDFSWLRRTRIDGDGWDAEDVPLGESAEQYCVRVRDDLGAVRREVTVGAPLWHYSAAAQSGDGILGAFSVEVAQISDRYGEGLSRVVQVSS